MQLQADLTGLSLRVSQTPNLSALGVARLGGLQLGWWTGPDLQSDFGALASGPCSCPGWAPSSGPRVLGRNREVARSRSVSSHTRHDEKASS